jgi:hypothetical protein
MIHSERLLKIFLRLVGVVAALGALAVFMPTGWMARCHEWLDLGKFPQGAIVEYLARSLSAFYAMFGGLLILVSRDPKRYASVITYVAVMSLIFGVVISVIDVLIGLPLYWTVAEAASLFPLSIILLVLQRNMRSPGAGDVPSQPSSIRS